MTETGDQPRRDDHDEEICPVQDGNDSRNDEKIFNKLLFPHGEIKGGKY